jgi:hypothetical protein
MALQKQNIPIAFAQGVDTKTDDKQVVAGKLLNLQNGLFTNTGKINKRNGLDLLSNQIDITFDHITEGQALSTYQDQLLLFNGKKAFSKLEYNEHWLDKGSVSSVINSTFQVIRNEHQQFNTSSAKISDLECYVWEDSRGGIRYSVVDSITGNFLVADKVINSSGDRPAVLALPATENLASQFVILYTNGTSIQLNRVFTDAIQILKPVETAASDLHENHVYDACLTSSLTYVDNILTAAHNNIYLGYAARYNSSLIFKTPRVIKIDSDNVEPATLDLSFVVIENVNTDGYQAPRIISLTALGDISFGQAGAAAPGAAMIWTTLSSMWIAKVVTYYVGPLVPLQITTPSTNFTISELNKISFIWNDRPFDDRVSFQIFMEFAKPEEYHYYVKACKLNVYLHGEFLAVTQLFDIKLKRGIGLHSKPFVQNDVPYIVAIHQSNIDSTLDLQSTYFILNDQLEVISKVNDNVSGGIDDKLCNIVFDGYTYSKALTKEGEDGYLYSQHFPVSNGIFNFASLKKGKLQSADNTTFSLTGVTKIELDYVSKSHFSSANLNDNLYVIGGILQNYDGSQFFENNFHLYPENVSLDNTLMDVTVTTTGTSIVAQVSAFQMVAATRIDPGQYFTINTAVNIDRYYVWYKIDGIGTDPVLAGRTGLQVDINSYDDGYTVTTTTATVLALISDFIIHANNTNPPLLVITNASAGATGIPTIGNITEGSISNGTYSYLALWKWIDNQGRTHRSTTSVPKQIVISNGLTTNSISVKMPILDLTKKTGITLEIYRTEGNGQGDLFYKVTPLFNPITLISSTNPNITDVYFIDTMSDADLISNELVYTTGGVLDNGSASACSIITTFKNRLFIAGLADKNKINYSKILSPDDINFAVGFNEIFSKELDNRGGIIVALAPMDDKLIIFKTNQIFFISGDGPNNIGQGDFSEPQLITTDVGCDNVNSVVFSPIGLIFKSSKGIYLLDRSLQVKYIGAPVEKFNDLTISSVVLLSSKNQIRYITEDGVALIYDYFVDQWGTFTNYQGVDCDLYKNSFILLRSDGRTFQENTDSFSDETNTGNTQHIPLVLETSNLSLSGLNGFQRVYRVEILGEYKGAHHGIVSFAYDYSPIYTDSASFDGYDVIGQFSYGAIGPYGETDGDVYGGNYIPYQFRIHLAQQKCSAIRIKVEDTQSAPFNEGFNISAITLQAGMKTGLNKLPANKNVGSS